MQTASPMQFDPDWLLLLIAAGVIALLAIWSKHQRRAGSARFLVALLGLGGVFFFWRSTGILLPPPTTAPDVHQPEVTEQAPLDPTFDDLWEKLTQARIQLDEVALENQAPLADPADEKLKKNVAREFGLGPDGSLPPDWVIHQPKVVGNILRKTVASDPFLSEEECLRQLESEKLPRAVCRRIEQLAASQAGQVVTVDNLLPLGIGTDYILREICRDEFTGSLDTSVGEMKRAHVLLEFTGSADNHLREAWLQHERTARLATLGWMAGTILAGLAVVYGLLKVDTTTHGYYSRQLLWAGVAAIIAAVVASL